MFAWTLRPDLIPCVGASSDRETPPWIAVIGEDDATGALADIYRTLRGERGSLANIHRVHSLFPEALRAHMELYRVLMFGDLEISRADAELIAVVVSRENSCDYCALHHADALTEVLQREGKTPPDHSEHTEWELEHRQTVMLDVATRLAQTPHAMSEGDTDRLREAGFTDRAILEIVLIASYFCFVNRVALGLGLNTSPEERHGFRY